MPDTSVIIETDIPARLDRLPWTRFHTLVVVALGITWVLDGLEVTVAGSIAGALQESPVLHFTAAEVGLVGSAYLIGAVTGAVLFGYLTDRFGRRIVHLQLRKLQRWKLRLGGSGQTPGPRRGK